MDLDKKILSDITVFMKYSKYLNKENRRETWEELVDRNKEMHIQKFPNLKDEINEAYKLVYEKKVLPSMRSLQFAGKPIEITPNRIFNCAYLPIDHPSAFNETIFLLLSGCGVGYSVQTHHIEQLPEIRKPNKDRTKRWLIADSIEGWADAVKILMKSYFSGGPTIMFDFRDIRPKGSRLVTSGGKAPGSQPLKECLIKIEGILSAKKDGDQLTPIECHDIICHEADAVLAGGIRRAALISLFNADDDDMLAAKSGNWWENNPQRGRANNSVVLLRHKITKDFFLDLWKRIEASGAGEPGIFFTNDKDIGTNPCISGDSLITVKDCNLDSGSDIVYKMPMKLLADLVNSSAIPPMILSYNINDNKHEWKRITAAMLTKTNAEIIEIEFNGKFIKCTPDHKIYTKNRGWVEAQHLLENDILVEDMRD